MTGFKIIIHNMRFNLYAVKLNIKKSEKGLTQHEISSHEMRFNPCEMTLCEIRFNPCKKDLCEMTFNQCEMMFHEM